MIEPFVSVGRIGIVSVHSHVIILPTLIESAENTEQESLSKLIESAENTHISASLQFIDFSGFFYGTCMLLLRQF